MKSGAHFQQTGYPALNLDAAAGGFRNPAQNLQQG
jgi:hypothetical protein